MRKLIVALLLISSPAFAQPPSVLTDIPAIHSLVSQVMQDVGEPALLLGQGSDPHSFQMRPSQARALSRADLLFFIGPALTPWLNRAIDGVGVQGKTIELLEVKGTVLRKFETDDHGHIDPHAWLSPKNAAVWLDIIAIELAEIDPENAEVYLNNAAAAKANINQLDSEIAAILSPVKDLPIIVFHDAYGYFADHYGLIIAGAIREGDAATPGAAHLVELRELVSSSEFTCAFGEEQHDPALLLGLFADANVRIGVLDPSGSSLTYGSGLYGALLRNMAQAIVSCKN